ncbi:hypothetical protein [Stenotrophomonas sp.]|uniref:hypothetical protein n=1 Tax=Stenotrophomonas sp. TaxID=69392 RepID=UPI0028A639AA|nr:hypothetical protein [Stenotrophomonas sp.]
MATRVFPRLISLLAVALLAACQQGTPAQGDAPTAKPKLSYEAGVMAVLQERYGSTVQLQGQWTQQLNDADLGQARPVHRDICADQSIKVQNGNYRMLAICTTYDDASPIELGSTDFIVLQRAADDGISIAAELLGQGSGTGGKPGTVTILQMGADVWGFQVDDELVVVGAAMRNRAWYVFDGGKTLSSAGWLRSHLDDRNAIDCNASGNCSHGRLDLNFDATPDNSQPQLANWPLRVQEKGRGCAGAANKTHSIAYDSAQARYLIPPSMQIESCD